MISFDDSMCINLIMFSYILGHFVDNIKKKKKQYYFWSFRYY